MLSPTVLMWKHSLHKSRTGTFRPNGKGTVWTARLQAFLKPVTDLLLDPLQWATPSTSASTTYSSTWTSRAPTSGPCLWIIVQPSTPSSQTVCTPSCYSYRYPAPSVRRLRTFSLTGSKKCGLAATHPPPHPQHRSSTRLCPLPLSAYTYILHSDLSGPSRVAQHIQNYQIWEGFTLHKGTSTHSVGEVAVDFGTLKIFFWR